MTHPTPDPSSDHSNGSDLIDEPKQLRFLRRLVTTLTVVMVGGLLVVITLLVIRLSDTDAKFTGPQLPETLTLPDGVTAQAVTFGDGWVAVVTTENEILILDATTGTIRQRLEIK